MLAVDTNVVVRLVTNDSPAQAKRAAAAFASDDIFVAKSVLLETEWVLRFSYRLDRESILRGLRGILGLPNLTAEDGLRVAQALIWYEAGLDFADALHLASSSEAQRFGTLDAALVKRARRLSSIEVSAL
jgi:predicted nucleic-acid-binding protein